MKKLLFIAVLVFAAQAAFAQTASNSSTLGGELSGLRATSKQYHVTTNTTINVATSTCKLYGVVINTSNGGTAWTVSVVAVSAGNQGTAANFINGLTLATSQNPLIVGGTPITGYVMQGGINIVTAGTTPGAADIWVDYK